MYVARGFMLDILDFYGRSTRHTVSLWIMQKPEPRHPRFLRKTNTTDPYMPRILQKPEPSYAENLRLPRKTNYPYRRGSELVSGKVLYAGHPRFLQKTHMTCRKSSDNAKAGAELNGKS